jgi:hypothetical protein
MDDAIREIATAFGKAALDRDWATAHSLLAPWLRTSLSVEDLREFFENGYRAILRESGIEEMFYPEYPEPEIGGNGHTKTGDLREPKPWTAHWPPIPDELTDANMRYWANIVLQCSDEQMETLDFDYFIQVWAAIAETDEGLRVGYFVNGDA